MDIVPQTQTVMFVGDYFTLMTTVVLDESLRENGETDDRDFAVRLASTFIKNHYGFDVEAVSNDIGVVDDDEVDYE